MGAGRGQQQQQQHQHQHYRQNYYQHQQSCRGRGSHHAARHRSCRGRGSHHAARHSCLLTSAAQIWLDNLLPWPWRTVGGQTGFNRLCRGEKRKVNALNAASSRFVKPTLRSRSHVSWTHTLHSPASLLVHQVSSGAIVIWWCFADWPLMHPAEGSHTPWHLRGQKEPASLLSQGVPSWPSA